MTNPRRVAAVVTLLALAVSLTPAYAGLTDSIWSGDPWADDGCNFAVTSITDIAVAVSLALMRFVSCEGMTQFGRVPRYEANRAPPDDSEALAGHTIAATPASSITTSVRSTITRRNEGRSAHCHSHEEPNRT